MNFLKAAVGAALACILCAGMSLTAMADTEAFEVIDADGQLVETVCVDVSEDPEYLKYKQNTVIEAMNSKNPAGVMQVVQQKLDFGSYLKHYPQFNGLGKTFVVDVSQWQYNIDWKKVKADGIDTAIIRVGYRGYGSKGTLQIDPYFKTNMDAAIKAGLKVGVYFYTQAITTAEAAEEADFCANALKGYNLQLPVYYDIEEVYGDVGRLDSAGLTKAQKTALCRAFCDRIETYGYQSGVYASYNWLTNYIDGPSLGKNYRIWIAAYMGYIEVNGKTYSGAFDMWQYTSIASINGISGDVDLSVMYAVDFKPKTDVTLKLEGNYLTWNSVSDANGYTVYDGQTGEVVADVTDTKLSIIDKTNASFSVAAYNKCGGVKYYGNKSNVVEIRVGTVSGLTAVRSGLDRVVLSWSAAENAAGYEMYTSKDGVDTLIAKTTETSCEIKGSDLGLKTAKVRAYSKGGITGDFAEIKLPGNGPANAPVLEMTGPRLVWKAVDEAEGYIVTLTADGGKVTEYEVKGTYLDVDNTMKGKYYVQAYLVLEGTKCRSGASNSCTFGGAEFPPKGELKLDSNEEGLSWNKLKDAVGYVIYQLADDGREIEVARVTDCSYRIDKPSGTVYCVKGYNVKGGADCLSAPSNSIMVSLPEITEVRLVGKTELFASIEWDAISGCNEYVVYLDTGSGYKPYCIISGTKAFIGGLKGLSSASVRVKGYVGDEKVVKYGRLSNELAIID